MMKIWVGVTDKHWFEHLTRLPAVPDEVNFWQPSGSRAFRALQPGEPFLFKLHSPDNFIVGGGYFVRYSALPASLAWDAFGEKNGVGSLIELLSRVRRYRPGDAPVDPVIGCNVLVAPFFLPPDKWVPVPSTWAANIVQGKSYDTESGDGAALWAAVEGSIQSVHIAREPAILETTQPRFGSGFLARSRLGQGAFRVLVTDAYQRRCAVTGEKTLPVLEAAHIKPYAARGPHSVANGILLRSDLHKLFDLGYVTITPELKVEVSRRLKEDWDNGREYYALHGKDLVCRPNEGVNLPSRAFLDWHNNNIYQP